MFFRLVFPNFWEIESDGERAQALGAAQEATADTKVAKVFLVKDNVWASVELFVAADYLKVRGNRVHKAP